MVDTIANHPARRNAARAVWQRLALPGADVRLTRFCAAESGQVWFARLLAEVPWERQVLRLFGRAVAAPRLSCWIGDPEACYAYSGVRFAPKPWTPALVELRREVERLCGDVYNSVLCNLYRDGRDCMGWHSDDEPELGPSPAIASLSLGAPRRFRLRHRRDSRIGAVLELTSGDLLRMAGATQMNYRHDLPRSRRVTEPRINLTFRLVHQSR